MSGREDLPSGTVTFLFTDVEGSTRLLQRDVASTGDALRAHIGLLSHAVTAHAGFVFETVGDAVYAAFARPSDAIAAALDGQRAMHRLHGPDHAPIRVRMALHVGEAEAHDGHYFGPALFRCSRILSLGHGGQVLASGAIAGLGAEIKVDGARFESLGLVHLRDLDEPEHIHQLAHGGLQPHHPPLHTEEPPPAYRLPSQSSLLVDRDAERTLLGKLVVPGHVVTLTGLPGVGKTRLAIAAATDMADRFPAGSCLIDCSELDDPRMAELAISEGLGLGGPESWGAERWWVMDRLRASFGDRTVLVLVDSADRVAAVGDFLSDMLDACPNVAVVVTSRSRLGLRRERVVHVDPLATYEQPGVKRSRGRLPSALELFYGRARDAGALIEEDDQTVDVVAAICEALDGLPLAIELTAPLAGDRPVAELLQSLDRSDVLPNPTVLDLPLRHRTMQAAFAWSLELLSEGDRRAIDELAVFVGPFGAEEARAVLGEPDRSPGIEPFLADLGERNVLMAAGRVGRWVMPRTLRRSALQRLGRTVEGRAVRRRHAAFVLGAVERREARQDPIDGLRADLEAAMRWASDDRDGDIAVRLAGALWRMDRQTDGMSGPVTRNTTRDLPGLSAGAGAEGGVDLRVLRDLGDRRIDALEDMAAASAAEQAGDIPSAIQMYGRAAERFRLLGDDRGLASTLEGLAALTGATDPAAARTTLETAIGLRRATPDVGAVGRDLGALAALQVDQGDADAAVRSFEESVLLWRRMNDRVNEAIAKCGLAICLLEVGDVGRAGRVLAEVESIARAHHDPAIETRYLEARAVALIEHGELERASQVLGAARRSAAPPVAPAPWSRTVERRTTAARKALGGPKWASAEAAGAKLRFEDALDIATRPLS